MAAVEEIVWQDSARDAWQDVRLPVAGQGKESADGVVEGLMAPSSGKARGILLPENWLLAWRIQDGCPQTLEVQEASIYQAASFSGARIHFPDALHHVGLKTSASGVILAALLPSGLLYTATLPTGPVGRALERLSPSSFRSHSLAAPLSRLGGATHLAVTTSHVLVGTKSGTLLTCALQTEQEVVGELKDADRVLGRLWRGLVSGVPAGSPICAVGALQLGGSEVGVAVHSDASLRLWDLRTSEQLLRTTQLLVPEEAKGCKPSGLMAVGSTPASRYVAVVYQHPEAPRQVVCLYELEEHGWAATFSQSYTFEGYLSSLTLTETGLTALTAPAPGGAAHLVQVTWQQHAAVAPASIVPASHYVQARLLLAENPQPAGECILAALEDLDLPDLSAVFVDRLLSAGVFSDVALTRTLASCGCPAALDRLSPAELADTIRRAAKVNQATDRPTTLRSWRAFAQSYAATWADLHRPLGLATDSSGYFTAAINSAAISVLRKPAKAEQERRGSAAGTSEEPPPLEQCLAFVGTGLGKEGGELLTELLLRGSDAQAVLDSFLMHLGGGASSGHGSRQQHREERERILQLRQSVHRLPQGEGGWEGVLGQIQRVIAGLDVGPGQTAKEGASGEAGAGLAIGGGVRHVVAGKLREAQHVLLLLGLIRQWGGQAGLAPGQLELLQAELLPAMWQLLSSLLLVHNLATIPAATQASAAGRDFSQRLSRLQIGDSGHPSSPSANTLSLADVTLSAQGWSAPPSSKRPVPAALLRSVLAALSSLRWRGGRREPQNAVERAAELAVLLVQQNQHAALKTLLRRTLDVAATLPHAPEQEDGPPGSSAGAGALVFLYGLCCLATETAGEQSGHEEAVAAFLKAAAAVGSPDPLLASVLRLFAPQLAATASTTSSTALQRVQYFELVLALLERYGHKAGALQCARAALQELDAAYPTHLSLHELDQEPDGEMELSGSELALSTSQAREVHESLLWGHVFDLALQLGRYGEAYAATVSNPDAGSGRENLQRLVTVLCEAGAVEVLCGQQLPYAGNLEQVHYELLRMAENSDVGAQPSPYRLLFAFHSVRHNWRQAAAAMHRFAERVAEEAPVTPASVAIQAESILAATSALRLVPQDSAWLPGETNRGQPGPSKRPRIAGEAERSPRVTVNVLDLQQQHALLLARLFLLQQPQEAVRRRAESTVATVEVLWLLLEVAAFDQALSLATFCLKGAQLRKELEAIFRSLAGACCRAQAQEDWDKERESSAQPRPVPSSLDAFSPLLHERSIERTPVTAGTLWRSLQTYLERYDSLEYNYAFRTLVADTLSSSSSGKRKKLPFWLLQLCKAGDPAALLRTLLAHGRLEEAAQLALDILDQQRRQRSEGRASFLASKKLSAAWLPYTVLSQLQHDLQAHTPQRPTSKQLQLQAALERELQQHVAQVVDDTTTLRAEP